MVYIRECIKVVHVCIYIERERVRYILKTHLTRALIGKDPILIGWCSKIEMHSGSMYI